MIDSKDDPVPIMVHERLLGVDLYVYPRDDYKAQNDPDVPLSHSRGSKIRTPTKLGFTQMTDRHYIARWARRNLFDGVRPGGA